MATVIFGGSNEMNALIYGAERSDETMHYIRNQFETAGQYITDASRTFFQGAQNMFEQFNGAEALRLARAAVDKVANVFRADIIWSIPDIVGIQNAGFQMQRWIMAMPEVRSLYQDQMIEGYSETYEDKFPGAVGEGHYDFRRATEGYVQFDKDDGIVIKHHFDELVEGDKRLTHNQKRDIQTVWDFLRPRLESGMDDPTSKFGAKL